MQLSKGKESVPIPLLLLGILTTLFLSTTAHAQTYTLQHDGLERTYLLHVPPSYIEPYPVPLVNCFHRVQSSSATIEIESGLSKKSDAEGFIVVYPQGVDGSWNAGPDGCPAYTQNIDDVGFITALIDTLNKMYAIDPTRIYVTGFSNGSAMTYRMAAERADIIAAIAPVAAQMIIQDINPTRPVPLIHFHDLFDSSAPYNGGNTGCDGTSYFPPVESMLNIWIEINGCSPNPDTIHNENGVIGRRWSADSNNADVILYTLTRGGHYWPTEPISAADLLWEFFVSHPLLGSGPCPYFRAEPKTGNAPLTVHFTDFSTASCPITTWVWDFDLDNSTDSGEQHPVWTYTEPGIYTVGLEVSCDGQFQQTYRQQFIKVFDGESALHFNGDDSYARCPTTPSINLTEALTIEAWIHPTGWGKFPNFGLGRIIDKTYLSLQLIDAYLGYNQHSLLLQLHHQSGPVSSSNSPENTISLDQWHHIAVTYNGHDEVNMYIDGVGQPVSHTTPPAGPLQDNGTHDLFIGNDIYTTNTFDGIIDEVRIWNVARTGRQIQASMESYLTGMETGLVGYYQMNEGNGEMISDYSTHGNDGFVHEAAWIQGINLGPATADGDEDGVLDFEDNCPADYNPEQEDSDGDGFGDVCDNCPSETNPDQADGDNDGSGDVCDACLDTDGDGYGDPGHPGDECEEDNCPHAYNPDQAPVEGGDVDCNGGIDVLDVLAVVNHILASAPLLGGPLDRADCNGDGGVDILDALGIINVILGLGECSPSLKPIVNPNVVYYCESLKHYLSTEDFNQFMLLVKTKVRIPTEYHLSQNYPNPFNPETTIHFAVPRMSHIFLAIYNIRGEIVKMLVNNTKEAGNHSVRWNGSNEHDQKVSSGVYFYRIVTGNFTDTKKMILLR